MNESFIFGYVFFKFRYIILLILCTSCAESASKYFKKGRTAYEKQEYGLAIKQLTKARKGGVKNKELSYMLAESYRLSNQIDQSTIYYEEATKSDKYFDRSYFWYAAALKSEGKYEEAERNYEKYIQVGTDRDRVQQARREYKKLIGLRKIERIPRHWIVDSSEVFNTEGPDYGLTYSNKKFYWTKEGNAEFVYQGQGTGFTDIYVADEEYLDEPERLNSKINKNEVHEACPAVSSDGQMLVFARSNSGKKRDPISQVDLYMSEKIFEEWTEPTRMQLNQRGSWTSTPCFSPDGKIIYFSSDRPGGRGGKDLWKGEWDDLNERFINIENLGKGVNTSGDEVFPYVSPNGDFYFSSDGHNGYGRLDIFKVKNFGKRGQRAINLGKPLNSPSDDFGILYLTDSSGYFSSDREGGKGFDDIYTFVDTLPNAKTAFYFLQGIVKGKGVTDSNTVSDKIVLLPESKISLQNKNYTEEEAKLANNEAEFLFEVETEKEYSLLISRPGYLRKRISYSTIGKTVPQHILKQPEQDIVFTTEVILDPLIEDVVIDFDPIFFEYNKWDVTPESEYVLKEMVAVMKDNPEINVEIGSHTDPRNTDEYNQELSEKRAKSVVDYIIAAGIDADRITSKGYGESVPLELKKDVGELKKGAILTHEYILALPTKELQEEAYRLDRRTEFKIIEVFK